MRAVRVSCLYRVARAGLTCVAWPGTVISGPKDLLNKRVFVVPMVGWESAIRGPEKP